MRESSKTCPLGGLRALSLACGAVSAGGLSEPGSGTQSALLLCIKSSQEVVCPAAGEVAKNMGLPLGSPGRGGEWEREEAVER